MNRILQACRRAPSLEGTSYLTLLMIVLNVAFFVLLDFTFQAPFWILPTDYGLHVGLLGAMGLALLLWTAGYLTGYVTMGTGAGFRVACLGIVSTLLGRQAVAALGFDSQGRSVYEAFPSVAGVVWLLRNVGLAAYAFGLVFVALSCWNERRLRRTAPAWTLPP